jgi:DNA-binding transcriptional LysR family regulator
MISCRLISDAYRVEVQLLRTFVAVARLGSFSAAAVELGYTQAAVSQQVAALENDLKTRLLNRRPVEPTEAGARLLEHAEPILLRLDAARADVTRMAKTPPNATLLVGATPLAGATSNLPQALAALRARMPRLEIAVETATRQQVATGVAKGELDLALTDGLTAPGDPLTEQAPVKAIGLSEESVRVVLPPDHPLAARTTLRLQDLADARWIDADKVAPPLAEIRRHAGVEGFRPALRYLGEDLMTLVNLAAAGHGLTLLPESALRVAEVTTIRVAQPRVGHRVELLHTALPDGSPATALADILTQRLGASQGLLERDYQQGSREISTGASPFPKECRR